MKKLIQSATFFTFPLSLILLGCSVGELADNPLDPSDVYGLSAAKIYFVALVVLSVIALALAALGWVFRRVRGARGVLGIFVKGICFGPLFLVSGLIFLVAIGFHYESWFWVLSAALSMFASIGALAMILIGVRIKY
ncbi:hypothetical protein [Pseudomonas farsensis]|uniref:Lipoprotein n=1 Tax=Pseudomonas farsensis TaxID=2745492 RepID=A0ABU8QRE4_9PSED